MPEKRAVVLFNLGGPDSLDAVEPFLFNLFNDKAIINLPKPLRWLIAKIISKKRAPIAKEIYLHMGGKSPILEETEKQAIALQSKLKNISGKEFDVFVCMRYWKPFAKEVISEIKKKNYKEILLLPLYPQFSTTTSESSIKEFMELSRDVYATKKVKCCYYEDELFIKAHVEKIEQALKTKSLGKNALILFSAHGLPEKIIKAGDPYQWQVEQTTKKIVEKITKYKIKHKISYQSRVGPLKWIGPNTEEEVIKAAKKKQDLIIIPIAFVSEHSETLVELDIEYKDLYFKNGGTKYIRVAALRDNNNFIKSLAGICLKMIENNNCNFPKKVGQSHKRCPAKFNKCIGCYG